MKISHIKIPATDGFQLAATLYLPAEERNNNRVVLINSAMAVQRSYYDQYARFLSEEGFTVITFDYRGMGDSLPEPLKNFNTSVSEWAEKDIAGVINWISEQFNSAIMVIGHSMGGQVIGLVPNNTKITAVLAIAAQSGYWRLWDAPRKYFMALLWYVLIPTLTRLFSYLPGKNVGLGEDLPAGVALEWARWGQNPNYIVDRDGKPIRDYFKTFTAPMLVYSFEDDIYAPKRTVEGLLSFYSQAKITHQHVSPQDLGVASISHFGFFREQFRSSLWRETADWLKEQ